eukprot:CAMPEP_0173088826 /NCGR_PEP_ID=MMETSP1102-20130122/25324_1 /TAXON_ID=49646 /ORGANISM="Geminigera sp., Strain Caron Lab Isolate" /LENGTH=76 /DNA_ID=CAMNT_0013972121 /DNA_START=15 /DNA_END=245 /DNA_ORIENTATION=-
MCMGRRVCSVPCLHSATHTACLRSRAAPAAAAAVAAVAVAAPCNWIAWQRAMSKAAASVTAAAAAATAAAETRWRI